MAPTYKLTYFDVTALAEPIRFLLSYGGIEFEDNRLSPEEVQKIKPDLPFGQVPILEVDGKVMYQSSAILRYLAKQLDLAGKDDREDYEIDAVVDSFSDLRLKIALNFYESDEEKRNKERGQLLRETLPFYLSRFEEFAKRNGGYLAIGRLTWADICFVGCSDYFCCMLGKNYTAEYSNLEALRKTVKNLPGIKEWINKTPDNDEVNIAKIREIILSKK